jgi:hypothetical protein
MDTSSFLRLVVPDDGVKFLAEWLPNPDHPRGGVFIHHPFVDIDDMADKATQLDSKGRNVYFACASFNEVIYKQTPKGKEYPAGRTQDNALLAKALWLDIDVGKANDANSYDTREQAMEDIKKFVRETGLPTPMIVSSGNGFHCYWLFTDAIPKAEWKLLASFWRQATRKAGIKIDPSRDTDIASVLRPAGTHNPKGNRMVKVVVESVPQDVEYYREILLDYIGSGNAAVIQALEVAKLGNSLDIPVEYPPSSMERITQHCQTIKWFKETGAADSEPAWRMCLGIAKHCTDGEELAHEWSSQDDRYDRDETQKKMDLWNAGPSLCEKFREVCSSCDGCTRNVKTPVHLGYDEDPVLEPAPAPREETSAEAAVLEAVETEAPAEVGVEGPEFLPKGFYVLNGSLNKMIPDENGVPMPAVVAIPTFWATDRVRLEDSTFGLRIKMEVRQGRYREFDLPQKLIADDRGLRIALAANEIMVKHGKAVQEYMQSYSDRLRQHMEEVNTFNQYGWTADRRGVLLGDKLITLAGTTPVRLSSRLNKNSELMQMFQVIGSAAKWIDGVNTLYNTLPNSEPYQYAICTQFGGWLCPLMESEEWNGIPLALTSGPSGKGKSTAVKIGLNAFVRSTLTTVTASTVLGIATRASSMGSVPVLFDEITGYLKTGDQLSDVLYTLSNGRQRIGGTSAGGERDPLPSFKLMSTVTANRNTLFQLTESKVNPEATQMRIFEIDLDDYPTLASVDNGSDIHSQHTPIVEELLNRTSGVLAEEYLTYIMRNREDVQQQLENMYVRIKKAIGETGGNAAKERFYARHVACTMIGAKIAYRLGYIKFDLKNLMSWSLKHVRKMRKNAAECRSTTSDRLSMMMSDFTGFMLITREYDYLDARHGGRVEEPMITLRGPAKVRVVLGSKQERGKILVTVSAIDRWCLENNMNATEFKRAMVAEGYVRNAAAKPIYLAKGVPTHPVGKQRCLELEYSLLQGLVGDISNVTEIPKNNEPEGELA